MADETPNTMNLDLNLAPLAPPSPDNDPGSGSNYNSVNLEEGVLFERLRETVRRGTRNNELGSGSFFESVNLEDWMDGGVQFERLREAIRRSTRHNELGSYYENVNLDEWRDGGVQFERLREAVRRGTRQRWRSLWRPVPVPPESRNIALDLMVNSGGGDDGGGAGSMQAGEGSVTAEERNTEVIKTCENNTTHVEDEALGKREDVEKGNSDEGSFFYCNICLDMARDPVVTCCGHLFCWPCLYRWLHVYSDAKECPVCKGEVTVKNVTPIYGRGNHTHELEEDSSLKIPLRPQARRVESLRQTIQRTAAFTFPMEEMIRRLGSRFDLTRDLVQAQLQNTENSRDSPERSHSLLNRILTSRGMRREQSTVVPPDDVVDLTQNSPTNSEVGESSRLSSLLLRRSHSRRATTNSYLIPALSSAERRRRNGASRVLDADTGDSRAPRRRRLN
ncbi:uncharacterized protein LOC132292969 isoform X2 [Cornus florida]|uniref:uncharacterized protein LOC132292969 isoform X2 n=1 Tax=Cornus florida TaxID=4283 RepID=UPI00289A5262|nr:uncharacterized protein LOC132292969 isoform X2 [Cornus florida]